MEVSGGSIHALCYDALAEILVRLDSESVLRCRAVCKSWHRIVTDRSFLLTHAARRPREMIVAAEYGYVRSTIPLSPDLDSSDNGGPRHLYFLDPCPRARDGLFNPRDCLDGLLVLEQYLGPYIICNPTTRQWANLPVLASTAVACGFYFHTSSGEYRILFHGAEEEEEADMKDCCYILSVGSSLARRLTHAPSGWSGTAVYERPVSFRGILHWLCRHPHAGMILAFDTVSETFRFMSQPPGLERPLETMRNLLELDGELCVATMQQGMTLDIWVLQDYKAENWTLRHRLNLPRPTKLGHICIPGNGRALSFGGNAILIGLPFTDVARLYDIKENRMHSEVYIGGIPMWVFSESLVPHAFFDLPPFN